MKINETPERTEIERLNQPYRGLFRSLMDSPLIAWALELSAKGKHKEAQALEAQAVKNVKCQAMRDSDFYMDECFRANTKITRTGNAIVGYRPAIFTPKSDLSIYH